MVETKAEFFCFLSLVIEPTTFLLRCNGANHYVTRGKKDGTRVAFQAKCFPQNTVGGGCHSQPAAKVAELAWRRCQQSGQPQITKKRNHLQQQKKSNSQSSLNLHPLSAHQEPFVEESSLQWSTLQAVIHLNICPWKKKKNFFFC